MNIERKVTDGHIYMPCSDAPDYVKSKYDMSIPYNKKYLRSVPESWYMKGYVKEVKVHGSEGKCEA